MWAAWQLSVLSMSLSRSDHSQPGWNVARPIGPPSMFTSSSLPIPSSNGWVSSGESRLLRTIPAIAALQSFERRRADPMLGSPPQLGAGLSVGPSDARVNRWPGSQARRIPGRRRRGGLTMPSLNWHDLDSFEPGAFYRQVESDKTVQFVGVASMPEVDGGDVGVFRFVEGGRCLIATKGRYEQGQTFTPIAEYEEPDEATTAEWRAFVKGDET